MWTPPSAGGSPAMRGPCSPGNRGQALLGQEGLSPAGEAPRRRPSLLLLQCQALRGHEGLVGTPRPTKPGEKPWETLQVKGPPRIYIPPTPGTHTPIDVPTHRDL